HREPARIDDACLGVCGVAVRRDADDAIPVDRDVDVGARRRRLHVSEAPGVHYRAAGRDRRGPLQIDGHRARLAGLDVDDAELIERLVEDVPRVALPAWRVRTLGADAPGRA